MLCQPVFLVFSTLLYLLQRLLLVQKIRNIKILTRLICKKHKKIKIKSKQNVNRKKEKLKFMRCCLRI